MFGLDFVGDKTKLERDDLKKIDISKTSFIMLLGFYVLLILTLVI